MIIPRKFSYVTDLDKIISTEEIFQETKKHESVLKGTSITNLIYFSRTYTITNRNIDTARGNGYFSQPEIVEKLQLHFAHLYFEVINEYFESGSMPGQWLSAGASRRFGLMSAEVSLLLAVKAHIQCDAPLALGRLGVAPELVVSDYFRIQKVLMSSSREVVATIRNDAPHPSITGVIYRLLIPPIGIVMLVWRLKAWRVFKKAEYSKTTSFEQRFYDPAPERIG